MKHGNVFEFFEPQNGQEVLLCSLSGSTYGIATNQLLNAKQYLGASFRNNFSIILPFT